MFGIFCLLVCPTHPCCFSKFNRTEMHAVDYIDRMWALCVDSCSQTILKVEHSQVQAYIHRVQVGIPYFLFLCNKNIISTLFPTCSVHQFLKGTPQFKRTLLRFIPPLRVSGMQNCESLLCLKPCFDLLIEHCYCWYLIQRGKIHVSLSCNHCQRRHHLVCVVVL